MRMKSVWCGSRSWSKSSLSTPMIEPRASQSWSRAGCTPEAWSEFGSWSRAFHKCRYTWSNCWSRLGNRLAYACWQKSWNWRIHQ